MVVLSVCYNQIISNRWCLSIREGGMKSLVWMKPSEKGDYGFASLLSLTRLCSRASKQWNFSEKLHITFSSSQMNMILLIFTVLLLSGFMSQHSDSARYGVVIIKGPKNVPFSHEKTLHLSKKSSTRRQFSQTFSWDKWIFFSCWGGGHRIRA